MKNSILILLIAVLFSCNSNNKDIISQKNIIGYQVGDSGEKISLFNGDLSTVEVWGNYLTAHNTADLELLQNLNADDLKIWDQKGGCIEGSEAYISFISSWLSKNKPAWNTRYMIANELSNGGVLEQWVTSGHDLTLNVEGEIFNFFHVYDALIVDGKVKKFYVNERVVIDVDQKDNDKALITIKKE